MSDANSWAGIVGLFVALAVGGATMWDSLKKRRQLRLDESSIVTTNAIQLVEQLRLRVNDLDGQLRAANARADDLSGKLEAATERADVLQDKHDAMSESLTDAQAEVRVLRGQVKYLSTELGKYTGGTTTT